MKQGDQKGEDESMSVEPIRKVLKSGNYEEEYFLCPKCGEEKTPLVWVARGKLVHLCEDCRKKN